MLGGSLRRDLAVDDGHETGISLMTQVHPTVGIRGGHKLLRVKPIKTSGGGDSSQEAVQSGTVE